MSSCRIFASCFHCYTFVPMQNILKDKTLFSSFWPEGINQSRAHLFIFLALCQAAQVPSVIKRIRLPGLRSANLDGKSTILEAHFQEDDIKAFSSKGLDFVCKNICVSKFGGRRGILRAYYRCQVSGWKVRFWRFLFFMDERAATGCGGILCGLATSSPPGSCLHSPFSMIINWKGGVVITGSSFPSLKCFYFCPSAAATCKSNVFNCALGWFSFCRFL